MVSLTIVFLFFSGVSYLVHGAFTFKDHGERDRHHVRGSRFLAINILGFALNQGFVWYPRQISRRADVVADDPDGPVHAALDLRPPSPLRLRMNMVELSLIIPVKDEEEAIGVFVARVVPILEALDDPAARSFEILFIDDGSSDRTLEVIRAAHAADPRIRGLSLSRNFGKEAALSAGLDHARGLAVIPIDVDLQDPPEAIAPMVAKWRDGFDVVYGVRDNRESDSLPKRLTADLYYRAHNWLSSDKIPEHAGDFRLLDRRVVEVIKSMPERNRFMKGLFAWAGFKSAGVSYHREERTVGTTKFNYWKLWTLAVDGITSASTVPLARVELSRRRGGACSRSAMRSSSSSAR